MATDWAALPDKYPWATTRGGVSIFRSQGRAGRTSYVIDFPLIQIESRSDRRGLYQSRAGMYCGNGGGARERSVAMVSLCISRLV